jgi:cytochrome c oxidase assembly protein subunit 15
VSGTKVVQRKMVSVSRSFGQRFRSLRNRLGFRHLLTATLGLVFATILLGVAAKATGSGLACQASWPQCDAGPFNLFPASLPSFYEWIHRFVAMFAGFAILGSGLTAWLSSSVDSRVAPLVVLGTVLTPVQVYLGRETVLQYRMDILSLHFWTAVLIFSLFTVATVLVWKDELTARHAAAALVVGLVTLPLHVALSPTELSVVTEYTPTVQLLQYGVTLALIASVVLATMVARWRFEGRLTLGILATSVLLALGVAYLGRRAVMTFNPALEQLYLALAVVLFVAFVAGILGNRSATSRRKAGL